MRLGERWPWRGEIEVVTRDLRGRVTRRERFPNLIVNAGLNLMRDVLRGAVASGQIMYVAIGTSATAPAAGDTQLGAEVYRAPVTSFSLPGGVGAVNTTFYVGPATQVGTVIAEIGWFAGPTATATANSGVLVAHVLYSHTHTNLESIQIVRTDTF